MLVNIAQGVFVDEVVAAEGSIHGGVGGGVDGDEDVGHDAATTVDGAALDEGLVDLGGVEMNAVERCQFAPGVAVFEVAAVGFFLAFDVRLLDAAAGRGVVVGDGEAYHGAVGEVDGALHKSLAEGASSDDGAAVVVLHSSADDFGGRSGELVNQYDHTASPSHEAAAFGSKLLTRHDAAVGIDDHGALGQKLARHFLGGIEIAAAVERKVEDEVLHALFLQLQQFVVYFLA